MADVDLATAGGFVEVIHDKFMPKVIDQITRSSVLLSKLEKAVEGEELIGNSVVLPVQLYRAGDFRLFTNVTSENVIPAPSSSSFDQMTIPLMEVLGSISVPDIVKERMKSNAGAWVRPWKREMKNLAEDMRNKINILLNGNKTGRMATVTNFSAGSPAVVTVDSTRNLKTGQTYDFIRSGSEVTNAVDITIVSITSATTFTATITGTPASGDIIVFADSYNQGPNGLEVIVDASSTSIQGIDRTAIYELQANVLQNNGGSGNAACKPVYVKQMIDTIFNRTTKRVDVAMATPDVVSGIKWSMYPDRRFDNQKKMEMFDTGMDLDGIPLMVEPDTTANTLYFLHWDSLLRGQLGKMIHPFADPEGNLKYMNVLNGSNQRTTAHMMTHIHRGTLAGRQFNTLGKLTEIAGLSDGGYGNTGGYAS